MYQLTTKKSIGTINLRWFNGTAETFQLGKGRFSLTPYQNFYLLNFWVVSEYEILSPDGQMHLVTGPTLEILTKTNQKPEDLKVLKVAAPSINERTGYYYQIHQDLNDAALVIEKTSNEFYDIHFSGRPSDDGKDYEVTGQCSIELSHILETYW